MPDLFSNIQTGIRKPDVIMNQGPLPSTGGLPNGFNGTTDARINYGSSLLGNIAPYEFGAPRRLANQTAYMNIPHKVQKIVPVLRLPEARSGLQTFNLSHAVDDGDIAFALRVARNASTISNLHTFERMGQSHMVDPFINLTTVNYLLAGIQRNWDRKEQIKWHQLIVDTEFERPASEARGPFTVRKALHFIQEIARPFGIAHGSEKQGGQHEGATHAVAFPVNFITTLAVSGRIENLVNLWRDYDISAGDDLILRLEWCPIAKADNSLEYVLNHWSKGTVRQRFEYEHGVDSEGHEPVNFGWQLVPDIYTTYPPEANREGFDWRQHGYWHICRTQIMKGRENTSKLERTQRILPCYYDDSRLLRGSLLEINFEPVFNRMRILPRKPLTVPRAPYQPLARGGYADGAAPPPPPPAPPPPPGQGDGGNGDGGGQDGPPPAQRRRIRRQGLVVRDGGGGDGDNGGGGGGGGDGGAAAAQG